MYPENRNKKGFQRDRWSSADEGIWCETCAELKDDMTWKLNISLFVLIPLLLIQWIIAINKRNAIGKSGAPENWSAPCRKRGESEEDFGPCSWGQDTWLSSLPLISIGRSVAHEYLGAICWREGKTGAWFQRNRKTVAYKMVQGSRATPLWTDICSGNPESTV